MSDALRNAVTKLRREAAALREQADARETAAETLEELLDQGRIPAPAPQRSAPKPPRQPRSAPPAAEPKPAAPAGRRGIDLEAVRTLVAAGEGPAAIARKLGCSLSGAHYAIAKIQGKPPPHAKPKAEKRAAAASPASSDIRSWSDDEDARMRDMRTKGHSWREVAEKLGRTEGAVIQRDFTLRRTADKARAAALNGARA